MPKRDSTNQQKRVLSDIRRSLFLAVSPNNDNRQALARLDKRVLRLLSTLDESALTKAQIEKLAHLKALFNEYEKAKEADKKRSAFHAISLIDKLLQPQSETPAVQTDIEHYEDQRPLFMSVQYLKGVGPKIAELLSKKGILTVYDVLFYLPYRWEDRRSVGKISALPVGEFGQAIGTIKMMDNPKTNFGRRPYQIVVQDDSGFCVLSWFHYGKRVIANQFKQGDSVRFGGKVSQFQGKRQIVHPDIEKLDNESDEEEEESRTSTMPIVPVYSEIQGIPKKKLFGIIQRAVEEHIDLIDDPLPEALKKEADLPALSEALHAMHKPPERLTAKALNDFQTHYQSRLSFDELFFVQFALARVKHGVEEETGIAHKRLNSLATKFYKNFKHKLTHAQARVLQEIVGDLTSEKPMNRLMQGDVGSGKTIVAVLSALLVIENGRQVAFMAPTEILAEQHFRSIQSLCDFPGVTVELLTGDLKRAQKLSIYEGIETGDINFVIGTHALLQKGVDFRDLGYVIIDEQHRFGVEQRSTLHKKGKRPDALIMTATPIPRSLSLTLYGDLDVSTIDELPKGRQPIATQLLSMKQWAQAERVLKRELHAGRQAFVITPLIEESEKLDLRSAIEEHERLQARLPDFNIGLLHGRMPTADRERVMRAFLERAYDVLVSTTVIEVGVDVPNCTFMAVQHAERFGLSQLHQLRGRVGRGAHQSYCFLMVDKMSADARERLTIMEATTDGFKIAEKDLEIRGPGDFLGTRQTGTPLFQFANLVRDQAILKQARALAFKLIAEDPELERKENRKIREAFLSRWKKKLELIGIG